MQLECQADESMLYEWRLAEFDPGRVQTLNFIFYFFYFYIAAQINK